LNSERMNLGVGPIEVRVIEPLQKLGIRVSANDGNVRADLVFDIELMAVAAPLPTSSNAPRAESARTCPTWTAVSRSR